jgi:aryl-alcohol dehydrogenase-like predicted oxidoreductase
MIRNIKQIKTSAVGMGCWAVGGEWMLLGSPAGWGKTDDAESVKAIQAAYANGIRFFDTAANYGAGHSERLLARALKGFAGDYTISTKFGFKVNEQKKEVSNYGEMRTAAVIPHLEEDCDASLKRLHKDCIDLYFFHIWDYDLDMALELRGALEDLVKKGKIRYYGWSTDDLDSVKLFADGEHCAAIQHNLNIMYGREQGMQTAEIIKEIEDHNLAGVNRAPLAMGFLTGKYTGGSTFSPTDVRGKNDEWINTAFRKPSLANLGKVREILTSNGRTLAQGALAWILARSRVCIPIPGIRTAGQAEENAAAMEKEPLTPAQMEEIESILG